MRIIAAEVALTPQGQPEVEVGMLPLDVDLPGPPTGVRDAGVVGVRLTLHTSRGDRNVLGMMLVPEDDTLGPADPLVVSRAQYEALLRSVERSYEPTDPVVNGFHAPLPRRPLEPGDLLKGAFASPGTVQGTARVVRTPEDAIKLRQGDILVCPGWAGGGLAFYVPLLASGLVSGVVTDYGGGILSQVAMKAREFGLPAVQNTQVGTSVIRDGMILTVDGAKGLVRIEPSDNAEAIYKEQRPRPHGPAAPN